MGMLYKYVGGVMDGQEVDVLEDDHPGVIWVNQKDSRRVFQGGDPGPSLRYLFDMYMINKETKTFNKEGG